MMSLQPSYSIAVLPGDGIGREVTASALAVLQAVSGRIGRDFHTVTTPPARSTTWTAAWPCPRPRWPPAARPMPSCSAPWACRMCVAPTAPRSFRNWTCASRWISMRACDRSAPGPACRHRWPTRVRPRSTWCWCARAPKACSYARGRGIVEPDAVLDTMKITRAGTARVCDFALRLARQRKAEGRRGHVTSVDKANVFASMAFWREIFEDRARAFPDITIENAYVDAMALNLVMKPWQYDVLVTENMFGDILSDLIAALVGGMGMAPSADIGDRHAVFQPAHGTAPDIAGQGIANPTAMLLSLAMMLDWLAVRHADAALSDGAHAIEIAVRRAFETGAVRPREFGGTSGTADITRAVIRDGWAEMNERVAMVGAGYWAQFQLEGWRAAGTPVVALCNRSAARAAPLASRFSVPRCYTNLAQMLDNEQPTLLDVVLPPEVQEDAVRAALERASRSSARSPSA
jgi:3-isopropylmalate dehydrogenase